MEINSFVWFYINKSMKPKSNLNRKDHIAETKTNKWLASNGISLSALKDATIWQLQAQKAAVKLIKQNPITLTDSEQEILIDFARAMLTVKTRMKITDSQSYKVLNLCKKINRRRYKAYN